MRHNSDTKKATSARAQYYRNKAQNERERRSDKKYAMHNDTHRKTFG